MTGPIHAEPIRQARSAPDDARPATGQQGGRPAQSGFPPAMRQATTDGRSGSVADRAIDAVQEPTSRYDAETSDTISTLRRRHLQPADRQPSSHRIASIAVLRRVNGEDEAAEGEAEVDQVTGLTVDGEEVSSTDITRDSAYKKHLNAIISEEARDAGLAPVQVRNALVAMADDNNVHHAFETKRDAVRAAVSSALIRLAGAGNELAIRQLVGRALGDLAGSQLDKDLILARLTKAFGGQGQLHKASKVPAFADALLEAIRTKQSKTWAKATTVEPVKQAAWSNDEMKHWNLRHYTSKFTAVLGRKLAGDIYELGNVGPPPFRELLSTVTLATMPGSGTPSSTPREGDTITLTFTSGNATSGHTSGVDWRNIGNVGDTFYGLFYDDQPATGTTPNFIRDAAYYAEWPASEFGEGWASEDWLGTADNSQKEGARTPSDIARKGQLTDIIADIFPEATSRQLEAGKESATDRSSREEAFKKMDNFEVKQHGPRRVDTWKPVTLTVDLIKSKKWWVDARTGKIIKLKQLLPAEARAALDD